MSAVEIVADGPEVAELQLSAAAPMVWAELASAGRGLSGAVRIVLLRVQTGEISAPAAAVGSEALGWLRRPDLVSVAVIDHQALGDGLAVALACDLRIAGADAEIGATAALDLDLAVRLSDVVGASRAFELLITGRRVSADRAAELGIVDVVAPADQLDATVKQLVDSVLRHPRAAVTELKAVLAASGVERRRRTGDLLAGLRLAAGDG
jgi:enoyl-CoA hydratase/carnithine racemase